MCGRYCLDTPRAELQQLLGSWLRPDDSAWLEHYAPRELIRPHEPVLAVRREHGEDRLAHMLWGLLPGWVKDPLQAPRPINARAETIAEKASFRGPWRHHRCLLPSTGFFEKGHLIHRRDRQLFWLAGVWDRWIGPDGSEVETCCVITTRPNSLIEPLHDRMPVIIPDGLESIWLEPGDGAHRRALEPMLTPSPPEPWECQPLRPTPQKNRHQQLSLLDGATLDSDR